VSLEKTYLSKIHSIGAVFDGTDLSWADLRGVHLGRTHFYFVLLPVLIT